MRIRYKLALLMIPLCCIFLVLATLLPIESSLMSLVFLSVGFFLLISSLFYRWFLKPIELLHAKLMGVDLGDGSPPLTTTLDENDELTEIDLRTNILADALTRKVVNPLPQKLDIKERGSQTSLSSQDVSEGSRFNEALSKCISYSKRHHKIAAILMIEVAPIGQDPLVLDAKILAEINRRFLEVIRGEDLLTKLTGNEFVILLNDIGKPKFASAVAEKLLQSISTNFIVEAKPVALKVNIGICICPDNADTLEACIEKSYSSLYKSKSSVGSNYQFYAEAEDAEARIYVTVKNDLQKAIENNELVLHYQPKLNIKKGTIIGVEVLLRWKHPTLGMIFPPQFLDVAEDSGSIVQIGSWALREACAVNKHWQNEGYEHIVIAMNLSTKQFYHPDLIPMLQSILNDTKLNPSYLELEINETTIMDDLDKTAQIMEEIVALGVQISIDHFGKGYTSISHLKHLPVSAIKIDRGFIKDLPHNPNDAAITSAIIALAHYLGIYALAEGVENAEQLQFLTQQKCDMVQGYFLSYPLPLETITQRFKKISDTALS